MRTMDSYLMRHRWMGLFIGVTIALVVSALLRLLMIVGRPDFF